MPSNGTPPNGTGDETEISRRKLLRSLGAAGGAGLVAGLAGCGEVTSEATSRTYEAAPVSLEEGAVELGHRLADHGTWEVTRSPGSGPIDAEVTLVNKFAIYSRESSHLGTVAMPAAEENGEPLNPLVDRPLGEVVSSEMATSLLRELGLARYADVDWQGGRGDDELVPMLGGEAKWAAFRNGEGADEKRLRIARVEHEGDVVFGVGAATLPASAASTPDDAGSTAGTPTPDDAGSTAGTPTPDDAGPNDDGGIGDDSPESWWRDWRERWRFGLDHSHRQPAQCYPSSTNTFVSIAQPADGTYVDIEGYTNANMDVRLPNQGTVEFDAKANAVGHCIDHLEWSYRLDPQSHSESKCNYDTTWTSLGTGRQQTFRWSHCDPQGTLVFEIRVVAVEVNGSAIFGDRHTIEFQAPA